DRMLQHAQTVGYAQSKSAAAAALADNNRNYRHLKPGHFHQVNCNCLCLSSFFGAHSGICALRIYKGNHRFSEAFSQPHHPQRLAIPFGIGLSEIPQNPFLCPPAFLVADYYNGSTVDFAYTGNDGRVVTKPPVAMK